MTEVAVEPERILDRAQQAVVVVGRSVGDAARSVVRDDDRRDVAAAGIVSVDDAARLRRARNAVGLSVLIPCDDDRGIPVGPDR